MKLRAARHAPKSTHSPEAAERPPFLCQGDTMSDDRPGLSLTVAVPVEELAYLKRRARYLEAVMLQVLRDHSRIREWFSAAELASLALPGLPRTKSGLARVATAHGWRRRISLGRGGERFEYHVTALPPRAFDHLVGLIMDSPLPGATHSLAPALPAAAPPPPPAEMTPPWMLPLLRLVKASGMTAEAAVRELGFALPASVPVPTVAEAREALARFGYTS